jgi:iron complex transport system permease protein
LAILRRLPTRNTLLIPLVGIMLGGVIGAITTFFAYRYDLLQTLSNWMIGDFSGVLRGRYELLWIVAALMLVGLLAADRFTVAGMGEDFTTNLGLNYNVTMRLGLIIVSLISAVVVTTVGAVPFLGLVVPNIVSLLFGDNLRRAVPWTALFGAGFVLVCDIIGRTIRYPYEVPVGMVMAVVGAILFLILILRKRNA